MFTLVPSDNRAWALCSSTKCEHGLRQSQNSYSKGEGQGEGVLLIDNPFSEFVRLFPRAFNSPQTRIIPPNIKPLPQWRHGHFSSNETVPVGSRTAFWRHRFHPLRQSPRVLVALRSSAALRRYRLPLVSSAASALSATGRQMNADGTRAD